MQIKKLLYTASLACLLSLGSLVNAQESAAFGVWKTEPGDTGGYLNVEIKACENAEMLCGFIVAAYDKNDEPMADYEHIGKLMLWDMKSKSATAWKSGRIWAPDVDKKYKSKMKLKDDALVVSGCVAGGLICRGQTWTKVN